MIFGESDPIRLVASDLDGTLLRRDGSLSERTVAAIAALDEVGIHVVLATARPPRYLQGIVESLPCHPLVVCSNGAFVWDSAADTVRKEHLIAAATALESVRRVRQVLVDSVFSVEIGIDDYGCEPHYVGEWPRPEGAKVARAEDLVTTAVVKVSVRHGEGDPWEALARVQDVLDNLVEVTRSGPTAPIELLASGVSKASGLSFVSEQLGISASEVLAIGDMPNDLSMLRWAGSSAAPANAHAAVLSSVDAVAGDCDEEGVAVLLEKLVAGRG